MGTINDLASLLQPEKKKLPEIPLVQSAQPTLSSKALLPFVEALKQPVNNRLLEIPITQSDFPAQQNTKPKTDWSWMADALGQPPQSTTDNPPPARLPEIPMNPSRAENLNQIVPPPAPQKSLEDGFAASQLQQLPTPNIYSGKFPMAELVKAVNAPIGNTESVPPAPTPAATASQNPELDAAIAEVDKIFGETLTDRDKGTKRRILEFLGNAFAGAGQAAQNNPGGGLGGLLGGALGGGVYGSAIDRTANERRDQQQRLGRAQQNVEFQKQAANSRADLRTKNANADWISSRPQIEQDKLDQKGRELDERARANTLRSVTSIVNRTPDFDPDAPENQDVVEMMNELGLPVLRKDPNRQIKYEQDPETGEMFVISTDKATGATTAQQINGADGKPLRMATKTALGMKAKELDRNSREAIAAARNRTSVDVANITAGSRREVANINQQGANARNDANNQTRIELGNKTKGMTANQLLPKLQQHANKKRVSLEQAKEDFRKAGIAVDEILQRQ